jgi:hypothetical protein
VLDKRSRNLLDRLVLAQLRYIIKPRLSNLNHVLDECDIIYRVHLDNVDKGVYRLIQMVRDHYRFKAYVYTSERDVRATPADVSVLLKCGIRGPNEDGVSVLGYIAARMNFSQGIPFELLLDSYVELFDRALGSYGRDCVSDPDICGEVLERVLSNPLVKSILHLR